MKRYIAKQIGMFHAVIDTQTGGVMRSYRSSAEAILDAHKRNACEARGNNRALFLGV
jgi:hypothetical protein